MEVLYLRWNEPRLKDYFETLLTLLQTYDFFYKRRFFAILQNYDFFYKWRFFARHTLLLKYADLWQRQQMPKTYSNIKLDFLRFS